MRIPPLVGLCVGLVGCATAPSELPPRCGRTSWGHLDKVNFQEGALVKKGDVLVELDPRPYAALLNQAKAKVAQDEAQLTYDEAEHQRNIKLVRTGAVSAS